MCRKSGAAVSGSWQTAYSASLINDSGGWNANNFRIRYDAAALADITASQVRVTIGGGSVEGVIISDAWIGVESGGSFQFASAVQVKWSGATSVTIGTSATQVSDAIALSINGASQSLVLALWINGGTAQDTFRCSNVGGNVTGQFKAGSDESSTTGALTGYTGTTSSPVSLIEFFG
jgi:hypothetical protein